MAAKNTGYSNFVLANEVEDQYVSHLDLTQFCTADSSLVGVAGDTKKINTYTATSATQELDIGEGNTESIVVSYTEAEYKIKLAQNRFEYYDEEAMNDPIVPVVGAQKQGIDLFNKMNADIISALTVPAQKSDGSDAYTIPTQAVTSSDYFSAFVDAMAQMGIEANDQGAPNCFALVSTEKLPAVRKSLKDELKYVEAFARNGYVGTVAGVNLYTRKRSSAETSDPIILATKEAVTVFHKKGTEVEQDREPNTRLNTQYARKFYVTALTRLDRVVLIG